MISWREKDHTIAGLEQEIDECETARRHTREDVHRLQEAAGVTNAEELKVAIDKSDRLRALKAEQAQVLGTLREAGDGFPVDVLHEECKEVDPDEVTAREASLAQELETCTNVALKPENIAPRLGKRSTL